MDFLYVGFGFQIQELVPTIQYLGSYMGLEARYDLPMGCTGQAQSYEETLSFQTHHGAALEYAKTLKFMSYYN